MKPRGERVSDDMTDVPMTTRGSQSLSVTEAGMESGVGTGSKESGFRNRDTKSFETFASEFGDRFTDSMVARFGPVLGVEASAAGMAYAFEHWERIQGMERPLAYLYRVAQSSLRPHWRWARRRSVSFPPELRAIDAQPDIDLSLALRKLSEPQRVCVLLVYAYGWTYREVSALLDLSESATTNHVTRGRLLLRKMLVDTSETNPKGAQPNA
jgi:DNA-directed RNA polymerase specialized sigma24 family protein